MHMLQSGWLPSQEQLLFFCSIFLSSVCCGSKQRTSRGLGFLFGCVGKQARKKMGEREKMGERATYSSQSVAEWKKPQNTPDCALPLSERSHKTITQLAAVCFCHILCIRCVVVSCFGYVTGSSSRQKINYICHPSHIVPRRHKLHAADILFLSARD